MIVYHVCGIKKLKKYAERKSIKKPVKVWSNILDAEKFSIQTGRPIILRLKFPNNATKLEGHRGRAKVLNKDYIFPKELIIEKISRKKDGSHRW